MSSVITDDVASLVNGALELLNRSALDPRSPRLTEAADARKKVSILF